MSLPERAYLGVDAGGSKTAWLVLGDAGVLAQGTGAALQVAALGPAATGAALADLIRTARAQAGRPLAGIVAGLAGAGRAVVRAELRRELRAAGVEQPVHVTGDVLVAAAVALADAPGVALWSGTGSFAVARAGDGALHRVGGRGWLLGDAGSAHDLARRAAAAVIAAADDLGPPTALARALVAAAGVAAPFDLGPHLQAAGPGAVAALYPEVLRVAEANDAVARAVQQAGADALAQQALAAARRAALPLSTLRVVLGGGLLLHDDGMRGLVGAALARAGVAQPPVPCASDPARGAAELARAQALSLPPLCVWMAADGAP